VAAQSVAEASVAIGAGGNFQQLAIIANAQRHLDRFAANRAILDIALRTGGRVDDGFVAFAAIRTMDNDRFSHAVVRHVEVWAMRGGREEKP